MTMDRRYTCYLTVDGEKRVEEEVDHILKDKLPKARQEGVSWDIRKQLLKRVLYLNRWLNYNSNPQRSRL